MIVRLRVKFIAVTMGVLTAVFAVVFLLLNVLMLTDSNRRTDELLLMIAEQDGIPLPWRASGYPSADPRPAAGDRSLETMRAGRVFYVKVDAEGEFFEINCDMMFGFTREDAAEYTRRVIERGGYTGNIDYMRYYVMEKAYGKIAVFAGRSMEDMILSQLNNISLWTILCTFPVLGVFVYFLSGRAVKPVENALVKQRRFISDAGHELKTPLTVIGTNIDVLENEIGGNIRLSHIKSQSERMNTLIGNLLTLAKSDEYTGVREPREFDLSWAVLNTALEFESRAFECGKIYEYTIEENIHWAGDEGGIRQILGIFIDNAIIHSSPSGTIRITLRRNTERGRPALDVYNTGKGISEDSKEKIFDRFYRGDPSRSRDTGSYGLGLSIAKAIADSHKYKIAVSCEEGSWIRFTLHM